MAKPLLPRRKAFIEAYLRTWNATRAAEAAGYSARSAYNQGHRLMRNDDVRAVIQERLAELVMDANETLTRLAEVARGEHAAYIQPDGSVDLERMQADGKLHLIKGIRPTRYGLVVEFADMLTALLNVGKHHGLFVDKLEVRGSLNVTPDDAAEAVELVRQYRERMKQQGEVARG